MQDVFDAGWAYLEDRSMIARTAVYGGPIKRAVYENEISYRIYAV
jgi:hypothetical protein